MHTKALLRETLYIVRNLTSDSALKVYKWARDQKIPNLIAPEHLHVSLIMSKKWVNVNLESNFMLVPMLNSRMNKIGNKGAYAIEFDNAQLSNRWQTLKNAGLLGYDTYTPHISVSYDIETFDCKKVRTFKENITLLPEMSKDLDTRFAKRYGYA